MFKISSVNYLFLVCLHNLSILRGDRTAAPLLKAITGVLGLGANGYAIRCFVYLVVHLACLISTVAIEISTYCLSSKFVYVCVVVHALSVSTQAGILLAMNLLVKLFEI